MTSNNTNDKNTNNGKAKAKAPSFCYGKYITVLGNYGTIHQQAILNISQMKLQNSTYHVLLFLLGSLGYRNVIRVSQNEIALELDIARSTVYRAYKEMKERNILVEIDKTYYLNTNIFMKGKKSDIREDIKLPLWDDIKTKTPFVNKHVQSFKNKNKVKTIKESDEIDFGEPSNEPKITTKPLASYGFKSTQPYNLINQANVYNSSYFKGI